MFDLPRDPPMLLNNPVKPLPSQLAAEANGPQSHVHAGTNAAIAYLHDFYHPRRLSEAAAVAHVYDAAIRLANAEPSVPIPVAEKWLGVTTVTPGNFHVHCTIRGNSKADEHQELLRMIKGQEFARE